MLLGRLREQMAEDREGEGEEGGQRTLVIDEDRCAVSGGQVSSVLFEATY